MGRLTVVMPVFDEIGSLPELYLRLRTVAAGLPSWDVELMFVDDGSRDGSGELVRSWMLTDPSVRLVALSRNFGHQTALTAGLDLAEGDVVVSMDSDLQDPPEVIPELLEAWSRGSMVVYARRRSRADENIFKRRTAHAFYRLINRMSEVDLPLDVGDFRLLDRQVVLELRRLRESNRYVRGMVAWVGFRQDAVEFDRDGRTSGETAYTLSKMMRLAVDAITAFSETPLRLVRWLGSAITAFAFVELAYTLVGKLADPSRSVPGYASLVGILCLVSGVQLLCLGVMGDYLGRVYRQVKERPLYVVAEDVHGFRAERRSVARPPADLLARLPGDGPLRPPAAA